MKQHADLLLHNGIIYTANNENSIIDAIAVKDGTIIFAGSNQEAGWFCPALLILTCMPRGGP